MPLSDEGIDHYFTQGEVTMTLLHLLTRLFAIIVLLGGCANVPAPTPAAMTPLPLDVAVRNLTADLFGQVRSLQPLTSRMSKQSFVVDPFIDANTAEVNETSRAIEQLLLKEVRDGFPDFAIESITPTSLAVAQYVVNGTLRLDRGSGNKYYRLLSSVVDLKSGIVIANAEVWLAKEKLNYEPIASYRDSPMYLKDKRDEGYVATSQSRAGDVADRRYMDSLLTSAELSEADKNFDGGDLKRALTLYQNAESRADGKTMKTYSALYQSYRKLGQARESEEAFAKLVDVGLQAKNLSTRFLFSVNSTDFVNDPSLRTQYSLWLRQISKRVASSGVCLNIVGHSSRSGGERYNDQLSLQRALAVQKTMYRDFPQAPQKTRAFGRGFKENVIGSGSDDAQDAIDRRAEFRVVDCASLT